MINKKFGGRGFRLTMTGADETNKRLAAIMLSDVSKFQQALHTEGITIFTEAKGRVPVDTGALKDSGKVVDGLANKSNPNSYEVRIGFGGRNKNPKNKTATSKYARKQHEMNKTRAKYLEIPFMQAIGGMVGRIAARMKTYKG